MKGRIRWKLLLMFVAAVVFTELGIFVSAWFFVGAVYVLIHLFLGPLDWFLLCKLYKRLKKR